MKNGLIVLGIALFVGIAQNAYSQKESNTNTQLENEQSSPLSSNQRLVYVQFTALEDLKGNVSTILANIGNPEVFKTCGLKNANEMIEKSHNNMIELLSAMGNYGFRLIDVNTRTYEDTVFKEYILARDNNRKQN